MNRIDLAIVKATPVVDAFEADKASELNEKFNMSFDEHFTFQEKKSLAHANGSINLEEANTIYSYLGNTVEVFNKQPLVVKMVLTKVLFELIGR